MFKKILSIETGQATVNCDGVAESNVFKFQFLSLGRKELV